MSDTNFHQSDELEQHLHASLHNYAPEAPERLWSGIEVRLQRRRRRMAFWWWLAGAGLALLSAEATFRFYREKQAASGSPATTNGRVERNLPGACPQHCFSSSVDISGRKAAPDDRPFGQDAGKRSNTEGESFLPGKTAVGTVDPALEQGAVQHIFNEKTHLQAGVLPEKNTPAMPEVLPERLMRVLEHRIAPSLPGLFPTTRTFRERHWQIGLTAGQVWLWQPAAPAVAHHAGHPAFPEINDNLARGWQAGISVAYNLAPHWRVRSGFNQRQTTQVSSHHATLRLMDGLCLNPNDYGPKEYEFEYALLTGSGSANMTVRIAQEDSLVTMPDDEPFTLTMHTTRRSTDWVLPFSLQYTFGRGRWQGSVQAGGLLTLPGKTSVRVDHFTEQCADLCFSNGRTPSLTIQERGKVSFSGLLGMGIEYRLAPHWILSAEPVFFGKNGQTGCSINAGLNLQF